MKEVDIEGEVPFVDITRQALGNLESLAAEIKLEESIEDQDRLALISANVAFINGPISGAINEFITASKLVIDLSPQLPEEGIIPPNSYLSYNSVLWHGEVGWGAYGDLGRMLKLSDQDLLRVYSLAPDYSSLMDYLAKLTPKKSVGLFTKKLTEILELLER